MTDLTDVLRFALWRQELEPDQAERPQRLRVRDIVVPVYLGTVRPDGQPARADQTIETLELI